MDEGRTSRRRFLEGGAAIATLFGGTGAASAAPGDDVPSGSVDENGPTASATDASEDAEGLLRVGVGRADLTWRAGAAAGQVGTGEGSSARYTPYPHSYVSEPSEGVHSQPTATAIVLERGETRHALVKTDLYLMHTFIHRRVAELVSDRGIARERLIVQAEHNHSGPGATSTAAGVAAFTDVFDARHWSYTTRRIAAAVERAVDSLEPATVAAVQGAYDEVQGNIIGPACATTMAREDTGPLGARRQERAHEPIRTEDGGCVRAGFPDSHFDPSFTVLRFDRPDGTPICATFTLGMHPESLGDGHRLLTAEFPGVVERKLEAAVRESTGSDGFVAAWFTGALGDVEPAQGRQSGKKDWWRESFARMEDMADRIVPEGLRLFRRATGGSKQRPGAATAGDRPEQATSPVPRPQGGREIVLPPTRSVTVESAAVELPPPDDRPWGPDNAYVTEQAGSGARLPSTGGAQESASAWLSVLRVGDVLLAGFPGEPITDLSYNFRSRVDRTEDNVYQGYHWPDEPDWVHDRIENNFSSTELAADEGFDVAVLLSQCNHYTGYCVTKWEYENRNHYRQSMTPYGPESAEYLVSTLVDLAREVRGGPAATAGVSPTGTADSVRRDAAYEALVGAEQSVRAYRAAIPPDGDDVGTARSQPGDAVAFEEARFSWVGGANAVDRPRVALERRVDGEWREIADGRGHEVVTLQPQEPLTEDPAGANPESDQVWTAVWEVPWDAPEGTYRLVARGEYRSTPGSNDAAGFFDPLGADDSYEVRSEPFRVTGSGPIPLAPDSTVRGGTGRIEGGLTFEPPFRNAADPDVGAEIPVQVDGPETTEVTATYTGHGRFAFDVSVPAGEYVVTVTEGAWVDPKGNPTSGVERSVAVS